MGFKGVGGMMGSTRAARRSRRPRKQRLRHRDRWRSVQRKQDRTMTKIDCLIQGAKKLREARAVAERTSDRALLYFIDMTLAHVCDSLDARSKTEGVAKDQAS